MNYPLYKTSRLTILLCLRFFCGLEIKGAQHIPRQGPVLLAGNHMSNLDPMVLGAAFRLPLHFMAKEELFRHAVFGALIRGVGAFPLRRSGADLSSMKEALRLLRQRKALLIFPQGTRTVGKGNTVHPGLGFLAVKTNAPVVPARVFGTEKVLPRGASFFRPGKIKVVFGAPLWCRADESYDDFSARVVEDIFNLC